MNRLIIICSMLLISSCKEITFREPQPAGRKPLNVIPKNLQGKYLGLEENGEPSKDTIVVTAGGYRISYFNKGQTPGENDRGVLSDSLILKSFKGYYFLNIHKKPEWLLRAIRQERNGDLIYMAPQQEGVDFKDYVAKLSLEIRIDSFKVDNEMLYQINPTPNQLIHLIEKGYFSRTVLKKIK